MKQKIALLHLIQELVQGVQILSKFIESETVEETQIKGRTLIETVNLEPGKAAIKSLARGCEICPLCEAPVRQITSHLKECTKLTAVDFKALFPPPGEVKKVAEVAKVVEDTGPPLLKLICSVCGETLENNSKEIYLGFWEHGLPCPKSPRCEGRLVSNMSQEEMNVQKAYRKSKPF